MGDQDLTRQLLQSIDPSTSLPSPRQDQCCITNCQQSKQRTVVDTELIKPRFAALARAASQSLQSLDRGQKIMASSRQPVSTASQYYAYHHPHQHYHDPALASLAYRPLHLPLQQYPAPEQHQQQHHNSVAAAAAGASAFQVPTFRHHQPLTLQTRKRTRQTRAMATNYQGMTEDELAELQKRSNEYEPEVSVCFCMRRFILFAV